MAHSPFKAQPYLLSSPALLRWVADGAIIRAMPEIDTIHHRIRHARTTLREQRGLRKLTLREVAEHFDISIPSVSEWESDDPIKQSSPQMERIPRLAGLFGVDEAWLAFGLGLPDKQISDSLRVHFKFPGGKPVPRLSPLEAAKDLALYSARATEHTITHFPCSSNAFQVFLWDGSNGPDYTRGDSVIVDPDVVAEPDDMVFARAGIDQHPVFGKLALTRRSGRLLKVVRPLNSSWAEEPLSYTNNKIIGVMTEHAKPAKGSTTA